MRNNQFTQILKGAIAGQHDDLEKILELYAPLIRKFACDKGYFDDDLYQYLLIHIALNISKFSL